MGEVRVLCAQTDCRFAAPGRRDPPAGFLPSGAGIDPSARARASRAGTRFVREKLHRALSISHHSKPWCMEKVTAFMGRWPMSPSVRSWTPPLGRTMM